MGRAKHAARRGRRRGILLGAALLAVGLLVLGWYLLFCEVRVQAEPFAESSAPLNNPNRGFYRMYGFRLTDSQEETDAQIEQICGWQEEDLALTMLEINLQAYRAREISPEGMENLDVLLRDLASDDRQLVVRFLYDWDGNNLQTEPEDIELVLRHMQQAGEVLRQYENHIFTLQGLFVGDWGEMHNTKYDSPEQLLRLARQLADVTDARLSVRTPAQHRQLTEAGADAALAARFGLFNDGILGSETDLGTYDMAAQGAQRRSREQELLFQETLCQSVPNGGEVVQENPYNDLERAVEALEQMHITYLNCDYDAAVLQKWAAATVTRAGCFQGMDGLSYIERRLGYRLFVSEVILEKPLWRRELQVTARLQNAGFAPLYAEPEVLLTLRDEAGALVGRYETEHDLCALTGGRDTEKTADIRALIPLQQLPKGTYRLFLDLRDPATGETIFFANTQERGPDGYALGTLRINF